MLVNVKNSNWTVILQSFVEYFWFDSHTWLLDTPRIFSAVVWSLTASSASTHHFFTLSFLDPIPFNFRISNMYLLTFVFYLHGCVLNQRALSFDSLTRRRHIRLPGSQRNKNIFLAISLDDRRSTKNLNTITQTKTSFSSWVICNCLDTYLRGYLGLEAMSLRVNPLE